MNFLKIKTMKIGGIVILTALITGCTSPKEKLREQIASAEKELTTQYDMDKLSILEGLYQQYINAYPTDSLSQEYLFRSGSINISLKQGANALRDFTNYTNLFPEGKRIAEAYFYKAHVYDEIMHDFSAAKTAYYDFLSRFAEHTLAEAAAFSLQYLGKSNDEIIALFEQQNAEITEQN